jgi:hypothetical protein
MTTPTTNRTLHVLVLIAAVFCWSASRADEPATQQMPYWGMHRGSGPGMMGYGSGYGREPGAMGHGRGYGMGPGMMGYGRGYGMGPGMMGYGRGMGMMGFGMTGLWRLDLSDKQRKEINGIYMDSWKAHWSEMPAIMEQRVKLWEQFQSDSPDAKVIDKAYGALCEAHRKMVHASLAARKDGAGFRHGTRNGHGLGHDGRVKLRLHPGVAPVLPQLPPRRRVLAGLPIGKPRGRQAGSSDRVGPRAAPADTEIGSNT